MMEDAQITADRDSLFWGGLQFRLSGIFITTYGAASMASTMPAEKPELLTKAGIVAAGTYVMTKMANDFFNALRQPERPIAQYRQNFKNVRPAYILGSLGIAGALAMATAHKSEEIRSHAIEANSIQTVDDPLASVTIVLENAKRDYNPDCKRGTSSLTYDEANRPVITYCTGPAR